MASGRLDTCISNGQSVEKNEVELIQKLCIHRYGSNTSQHVQIIVPYSPCTEIQLFLLLRRVVFGAEQVENSKSLMFL